MTLHTSDFEEIKPQWRVKLEDPLSISTRGKRRLLLVASTIAFAVIQLGLLPTKIEALGIAFEGKNRNDFLFILFAINAYAWVGFVLYAWADFLLQIRLQRNAVTGHIDAFMKGKAKFSEWLNYPLRFLFDFVAPLTFGGYVLHKLYMSISFEAIHW
ncbi:MAG: hypothetical protein ACOYBW_10670 [Fluviibacter phosphoraccumulans]